VLQILNDILLLHNRCLGAFTQLRKTTVSFVICVRLSVRMEHPGSHWTDFPFSLIFEYISKNVSRKLKFHENFIRITSTLHEDSCTFITLSRRILLRMRNFSEKKERNSTRTFLYVHLFSLENRAIYEIIEKNIVGPDTPDNNTVHASHCMLDT